MGRGAATRLVVAVAVAVVAAGAHVPAQAASGVHVSYDRCYEVTAVAPAAGVGTVLAVVTFTCESAAVDGREIGAVAVSEVVALQPDASYALLRTTTTDADLHAALTRTGLPSVLAADISIAATVDTGVLATHTVAVGGRRSSSSVHAGTARVPTSGLCALDGDALAHHYDGERGRVTTRYRNTLSDEGGAAGGGAGTIDATGDEDLRRWLGTRVAGASVAVVAGSWTAVVEREARQTAAPSPELGTRQPASAPPPVGGASRTATTGDACTGPPAPVDVA